MGGYDQALERSRGRRLPGRIGRGVAPQSGASSTCWPADRAALARFPAELRDRVPVLLTAHSLPKRVVDREPEYVDQLQATARAVAARGRPGAASAGRSPTRAPATRPRSG